VSAPFPPVVELVPHDPPMLLIDELLEADADHAVSRVSLTERSTFVVDGKVPALVTVEYMAQTIAAFAGTQQRAKGEAIQLGFLMGCRSMTLAVESLSVGDELRVEVKQVWASDKLGQFECAVTRDGLPIAQATLSVYQGRLEEAGIE
jgi:predicted hotdog family 3-hydroxylacyl-ACP dehydratase